jgi:hypothetical protein
LNPANEERAVFSKTPLNHVETLPQDEKDSMKFNLSLRYFSNLRHRRSKALNSAWVIWS